MPNGKRLKIDYCPITKQPVGPYASKLANYLGTHAWNGIQLPLTYADWRYLPTQKKDDVWQQVQSKFEVDPCLRDWVDKSLGKKWKDFKSDLKVAHYYTHESREERIKDCDIRVEKDQWEFLMDFWDSQKGMERSTTNKGNRALQRTTHTSGSKSFARVWKKELQERVAQLPEDAHDEPARDDVFSQVLGKGRRGRVSPYGLGVCETSLWGRKTSQNEELRATKEDLRIANEKLVDTNEKLVATNEQLAATKEELIGVKDELTNVKGELSTIQSQVSLILSSLKLVRLPNVVGGPSETLREVPGDIANAPMTFPNVGVRLASHLTASHEIRQTKRRKGN